MYDSCFVCNNSLTDLREHSVAVGTLPSGSLNDLFTITFSLAFGFSFCIHRAYITPSSKIIAGIVSVQYS